MKALTISLFTCFLFSFNAISQNTIEANVENWEYGTAKIGVLDFISGSTQKFGSIDKNGNLSIELQPNFLQKMKEQMEKEQEKSPEGWKASLKTVSKTFSCFSGDLTYKNGDTNLSSLPKQLVVFKNEKEILGILMPASNKAIADFFFSNSEENSTTGKYLEWTYLDEPATVKGTCNTTTFTQAENESFKAAKTYSLDLKKGWNLIEYHITEVFEDSTGQIYPKTTEIQLIKNIPSEINWYFSAEK
ncbi:hypothetical protein [Salegentibacter salegens]|jgi:hypothetical protein|uniref:GLPGLI family protein n=1 Tax=Salegentibacter salegens TaxID=143223 RepID=A0A1M7M1H1_9FLAO|nr:hypothetical protein [Salegentibacter salegens]PRX44481.1 hypothetical protein LY58_02098 [Salegentibacter salegens]SHM84524.1 hypothetical protein SAMN05878281_2230 [Salegentibacter salegens]